MTQTARTAAAFLLAVFAAVLLAVAFIQLVQRAPAQVQAPAAPVGLHRIDAVPAPAAQPLKTGFAALEGTDALSGAEQSQVEAAADRVCEGVTGQVPVMGMADTLVEEQGMTDEQARAFVNEVAVQRC
jgi:hypothetical protein